MAQRETIEYIHARTCYEFSIEHNLPQLPFIQNFQPQPMLHLPHGWPGSGKSEGLKRLRSYWEAVRKYEHGMQLVFVAVSNAMANNIGGSTMHSNSNIGEEKM
eukprot:11388233-Karenia_brevis.AAC.1